MNYILHIEKVNEPDKGHIQDVVSFNVTESSVISGNIITAVRDNGTTVSYNGWIVTDIQRE